MTEQWTIRRVLQWTAKDFADRGIDSARLDAELLVAEALQTNRVGLYLDLDRPLQPAERTRIRELVKRRRAREPVAFILGRREFYGRVFEVSPAVLVPRPDTETLVEAALSHLPAATGGDADGASDAGASASGEPVHVLDLCTGSGAVAVTLAAERPHVQLDATDLSAEALAVGRRNAQRHAVEGRIGWWQGDLFAPLPSQRRYRLVVSNPPYVPRGELEGLQPEVAQWEPRVALDGGDDGLEAIRRIADAVGERLEPEGVVLLEVGAGQADGVSELLQKAGLVDVHRHKDLAGFERVVQARRR